MGAEGKAAGGRGESTDESIGKGEGKGEGKGDDDSNGTGNDDTDGKTAASTEEEKPWWSSLRRPLSGRSAAASHVEGAVRRLVNRAWPALDRNGDGILDREEVAALATIFVPGDMGPAMVEQALGIFGGEGMQFGREAFVQYVEETSI